MLPTTMKRGVLTGVREVRVEDAPVPEPGPGEVLIRVAFCAICTWEQRVYAGVSPLYPLLGGHEISGTVAALGDGVANVTPGDNVIASGLYRCNACDACRRGFSNLCERRFGARQPGKIGGPAGFGQFILRRAEEVFRLSPDVPLEEAALGEPIACVLRSIKRAHLVPGDRVVVAGAGIMGLLHLQLLKGRVAKVIVSEPDPRRHQMALDLGADAVINPAEEDYAARVKELLAPGATVTFVAVSATRAIEAAVGATVDGGRIMCYAALPKGETLTLDPNVFHHHEVTITGTVSQTLEDFHDAAQMLSSRRLVIRPFLTSFYGLDDLQPALEEAVSKGAYRVVIDAQRG